ncbi:hypothetical protein [Acidiphilium sp.]|uniref:hypothetical protein n=1 Tax=Acidiphilium sp. TaxID=527 RepID=UPI002582902F|nr:hypothetical protein [Acidiphilium sp.]
MGKPFSAMTDEEKARNRDLLARGMPGDWQDGDPEPPERVDARQLSPAEFRAAKNAWSDFARKMQRGREERQAMARIAARPIHNLKGSK